MCCGSPDISIEYRETSNSKKYQKEMQYIDKNKISGRETGGIYSDLYEQYARKERRIKLSEKYSKRPNWNINKPGKRYIPASERYPKQLQKQREENKVRRQMELLQLVERNTPGNLCPKKGGYSDKSPSPQEEINMKNKGHRVRKVTIWSLTTVMCIFKTLVPHCFAWMGIQLCNSSTENFPITILCVRNGITTLFCLSRSEEYSQIL